MKVELYVMNKACQQIATIKGRNVDKMLKAAAKILKGFGVK